MEFLDRVPRLVVASFTFTFMSPLRNLVSNCLPRRIATRIACYDSIWMYPTSVRLFRISRHGEVEVPPGRVIGRKPMVIKRFRGGKRASHGD